MGFSRADPTVIAHDIRSHFFPLDDVIPLGFYPASRILSELCIRKIQASPQATAQNVDALHERIRPACYNTCVAAKGYNLQRLSLNESEAAFRSPPG